MTDKNATTIQREDLKLLPVPESTDTFQPISHSLLVDKIEEALSFRHIRITNSEFAVSPDGMKMFGCLQVNADYEGVNFAIGLRNANDKSMRLGMVAGYRVMVCSNMAFNGEFNPLLAKHSKNFDLIESVSIGVDRIQRSWQPLREAIDLKRDCYLEEGTAREFIYKLFTEFKFPVSLFKTVHKEYFEKPSYDDFSEKTVWSLENACTHAIKKLNPLSQYTHTAKLGKIMSSYQFN